MQIILSVLFAIHGWKKSSARCYLGAKYAGNWNCPDFTWND